MTTTRLKNKSFYDCINERFSCRSFTSDKLKTPELGAILEAARLAPTACNNMPQRIVVVENQTLLDKLKEATKYLFDAKTVFVICYDEFESWHRRLDNKDHGDIDASIVATHMVLMATSLDIGSCIVCSFDEEKVKSILSLPKSYHVSIILPVGYPKDIRPHGDRKDLEDIVIYK